MIDSYQIGIPVSFGSRKIFPVLRISDVIHGSGFWIHVTPVALLIEELGKWSFVTIEEGISEDIIHQIAIHEDL